MDHTSLCLGGSAASHLLCSRSGHACGESPVPGLCTQVSPGGAGEFIRIADFWESAISEDVQAVLLKDSPAHGRMDVGKGHHVPLSEGLMGSVLSRISPHGLCYP